MSWIHKLYETYENCKGAIGEINDDNQVPLLPICHTTQKAQIEICIDGDGNYQWARVIPKDEARTIIPCNERSGGRTSGAAPHPLCDKLQYIAGDLIQHGGTKKSYFGSYSDQLQEWCESEFSALKVKAVFGYIIKRQVIKDLVREGVLIVDENNKLIQTWVKDKEKVTPRIFEVCTSQEDAFIRWIVEIPDDPENRVWADTRLWEKWILFFTQSKGERDICLVTGESSLIADKHPAKIRNDGDKAKLISSNDTSGFTFRGRFFTADQAASLSFEATQKAHAALRWLISRQGYRKGDLTIVAWATNGAIPPTLFEDTYALLGYDNQPAIETPLTATAQELAIKLKRMIAGYHQEIGETTDIVVMGLDSATPGRMAILYYCAIKSSDFFKALEDWHLSCAWNHQYRARETTPTDGRGKPKKSSVRFSGAPAPKDIIVAAYGERVDDKLFKNCMLRLLPCMIEGRQLPRDIVESAVRRASNRSGKGNWEWNKCLTIACALYRKFHRKEDFDMSLDTTRNTRDYLYGRLLAIAENLEGWALSRGGEKRDTNAARMMQRFSEHPYSTWRNLELALAPYKARLGNRASKLLKLMDEIMAAFQENDFMNDKRLSGEFLLGYHCQRENLRAAMKEAAEEIEEIEIEAQ